MPKKGFTVITIKKTVRNKLDELAKKLGKSPQETLNIVVDAYTKKQEKEVSS